MDRVDQGIAAGLSPPVMRLQDFSWSGLQAFLDMKVSEGQHLEYKRQLSDSVLECAVAFANSGGGQILIGVDEDRAAGDDSPGSVVGVSPSAVRQLENMVVDTCHPPLSWRLLSVADPNTDKQVVVVVVPPSSAPPHYHSGKGVLVRTGRRIRHATILELRAWFRQQTVELPAEVALRERWGSSLLGPLGPPGIALAVLPLGPVSPRRFTYETDECLAACARHVLGAVSVAQPIAREVRFEHVESHRLQVHVGEQGYFRVAIEALWLNVPGERAVFRAEFGYVLELILRGLIGAHASLERVFDYHGPIRVLVHATDKSGWRLQEGQLNVGVSKPHPPTLPDDDDRLRQPQPTHFAIEAGRDDLPAMATDILLALLRHLHWRNVESAVAFHSQQLAIRAQQWRRLDPC